MDRGLAGFENRDEQDERLQVVVFLQKLALRSFCLDAILRKAQENQKNQSRTCGTMLRLRWMAGYPRTTNLRYFDQCIG